MRACICLCMFTCVKVCANHCITLKAMPKRECLYCIYIYIYIYVYMCVCVCIYICTFMCLKADTEAVACWLPFSTPPAAWNSRHVWTDELFGWKHRLHWEPQAIRVRSATRLATISSQGFMCMRKLYRIKAVCAVIVFSLLVASSVVFQCWLSP